MLRVLNIVQRKEIKPSVLYRHKTPIDVQGALLLINIIMAVKSYSEKLKDPRWQKKRLSILERDKWKCRSCLSGESTLHVHHMFYEKGREPWEAEDHSLMTLCENCHLFETQEMYGETKRFMESFKRHGVIAAQLWCITKRMEEKPTTDNIAGMFHYMLMDEDTFAILKSRYLENMAKYEQNG